MWDWKDTVTCIFKVLGSVECQWNQYAALCSSSGTGTSICCQNKFKSGWALLSIHRKPCTLSMTARLPLIGWGEEARDGPQSPSQSIGGSLVFGDNIQGFLWMFEPRLAQLNFVLAVGRKSLYHCRNAVLPAVCSWCYTVYSAHTLATAVIA